MRYYRCGNCGSRLKYYGGGLYATRCPECAEMADRIVDPDTDRPGNPTARFPDPDYIRFGDPEWSGWDPDWYRPAVVRGPTEWTDVAAIRSGNDRKIWVPGKPAVYESELKDRNPE